MAVAACPKPETLAAFARGDLAAAELASVAEHVGACAACCRALKLVPEDSLAGLARAAAVGPGTVHPAAAPSGLLPNPVTQEKIPAGFVNHSRYRILGELGAGGMGTVYKAEDLLLDRVVALKVVSPHLTARASALARFQKEMRAVAKLEHANIVRAYDAGEAGGAQFLVMEFVEGTSLDRLVARKGPLPVQMACAFTRQAALGLQHAAEKGMTHRDIKPQNLMVTRKGQVRILDFGLARFARTEDADEAPAQRLPFGAGKAPANAAVTNPNLLMGTPDYLSPEQAKNSHDVDPRSDIYSLGCTLYFLLTGKPPFASAATLIDKLLAHTEEAPPPVREARFEVPEGLAEVLARMMAKKPADRYQSAKEAADALAPYTRADAGAKEDAKEPVFEIVEAAVVTPAPLLTAPIAAVEPLALDTDPQRGPTLAEVARPRKKKRAKRRSWWGRRKWAVLGAAALFLLVAGVIAATSGKKGNDAGEKSGGTAQTAPPAPNQPKGKAESPGPANPGTPPTVVTPGKTVLFVLPSDGVYWLDYEPVRARLQALKVTVKTCSGEGGSSRRHGEPKAAPVPVDYSFRDMREGRGPLFRNIDAVIFCGYRWDEYTGDHPKSYAAKDMIKKFAEEKKVVAAICVGQAVLVEHDVLKGKNAARSPKLLSDQPQFAESWRGITWKNETVVTDGKVVTAARPEDAEKFADAIARAIEK